MSVVIETSIGDIVVDLYTDERPTCSKNFIKLCKMKYYHYCLFHSIQKDYIAQTGDPTGSGRGGESVFSFAYGEQARYFEMEKFPIIKHKKLGTLSMINNGSDMHGSQFLITLSENLDYLDGKHTVFGEVAKGFDVIQKLNDWICDKQSVPYQDIRIFHTVILHDPFEDFAALSNLNGRASPEPTDERLNSERIRVDEELDQLDDMSHEEIEKYMRDREAKTRAKLLEIIGDLPDADMKPPENVLFVCKLNPVTTDEDLELIFSRFGQINSCEVIRDSKTGDSLCYAFVEFERKEDCENAYFKMDNVLIDDRRIHVDFSQSVAKVVWRGKGTGTGYFEDNRNFKSGPPGKEDKYKIAENKSIKGKGYDLLIDEENFDKSRKYEPVRSGGYRHGDKSTSRHEDRSYRKRSRSRDRHYKSRERTRSRSRDRDSSSKHSHHKDKRDDRHHRDHHKERKRSEDRHHKRK